MHKIIHSLILLTLTSCYSKNSNPVISLGNKNLINNEDNKIKLKVSEVSTRYEILSPSTPALTELNPQLTVSNSEEPIKFDEVKSQASSAVEAKNSDKVLSKVYGNQSIDERHPQTGAGRHQKMMGVDQNYQSPVPKIDYSNFK